MEKKCLKSSGTLTFAYKTGWRASEIRGLTWRQVDLNQGIVRLEVGETKNAKGRTVYLDAELRQIFEQQYEARKRQKKLIPFVFPNKEGDDRINEFRGSWNKACRDAGLGYGYKNSKKYVEKWKDKLLSGPILHDFRRTAVRNMIRSGIPERVAMRFQATRPDRYLIATTLSAIRILRWLPGCRRNILSPPWLQKRLQSLILKKKKDQPLHQIIAINPLILFGARGRN